MHSKSKKSRDIETSLLSEARPKPVIKSSSASDVVSSEIPSLPPSPNGTKCKAKSTSPPELSPSPSLDPDEKVIENVRNALDGAWIGNHPILHNKWTRVPRTSTHLTGDILKQQPSARPDIQGFCTPNNAKLAAIWDAIWYDKLYVLCLFVLCLFVWYRFRYGLFRWPQIGKMSYNPFVRISMVRPTVDPDDDDADDIKSADDGALSLIVGHFPVIFSVNQ